MRNNLLPFLVSIIFFTIFSCQKDQSGNINSRLDIGRIDIGFEKEAAAFIFNEPVSNTKNLKELLSKIQFGTVYERRIGESDMQFFLNAVGMNEKYIGHGVFGLNRFNNNIVGFFKLEELSQISIVFGCVLKRQKGNKYKLLFIDAWDQEGRDVRVESVFVDEGELFVMYHRDMGFNGLDVVVRVYYNEEDDLFLRKKSTVFIDEHCNFWWNEEEDDFVYPAGGESTENATFIECELTSKENILKKYYLEKAKE